MLPTILNEYLKLAIAEALLLCTLPHTVYRSTLVKGEEKNSKYAGKVIRSNFSSKEVPTKQETIMYFTASFF